MPGLFPTVTMRLSSEDVFFSSSRADERVFSCFLVCFLFSQKMRDN